MRRNRIVTILIALAATIFNPALFADTGLIATVAGGGTGGLGGPATSAMLGALGGIRVDGAGNFFVVDGSNNRVVRVDAATGAITLVAGNGTAASSGDFGPATQASLFRPRDLALDAAGNLFIVEMLTNRIRRVDAATGIITTAIGTGSGAFTGDGGPAANAALFLPTAIVFDAAGNLYIADSGNARIRRVDGQTGIITTVAGNGGNSFTADGAAATSAGFSPPLGVGVDHSGSVLISEFGSYRIRRVDAVTGILSTIAGNGSASFTGDGVPATSAGIGRIVQNVVSDLAGNLFFPDGTGRVRRVDAATGIITTVAGNGSGAQGNSASGGGGGGGSSCYTVYGDYGPATNATLDGAYSVAFTSNGNLLVSDALDCRVRRVFLPSPIPYTNTTLTASPASVQRDQPLTLTAAVSGINAGGTPTGSITFVDQPANLGATVLGTASLTGGTASLVVSGLPTYGSNSADHLIVAYYTGDGSFNGSGSPGTSVTVYILGTPTVTLSSSQNPTALDTPTTFTVTVAPPSGSTTQPTGTVQIWNGSSWSPASTLVNGSAQFSLSFASAGTYAMSASYSGDANFVHANSATLNQTAAGQTPTTTTLATSLSPSVYGQSVTFTASVSPVSATGQVVFRDGGTVLGSATLAGGTASWTTAIVGAGSRSITAAYQGDSTNGASTSAVLSQTVTQATPTFTLVSSQNPSQQGQSVMFSASVSPTSSGSFLTIQDTPALQPPYTFTYPNGGVALTTAGLEPGRHSITAVWPGDANVQAGTSVLIQTVQAATTLSLSAGPGPFVYGQSVTLTVTVSSAAATGSITFSEGATTLGTAALSSGSATLTVPSLPAGVHQIAASYNGDGIYLPSSSTLTVTLGKASTVVALSSSQNPSVAGQSVTLSAVVSPNSSTGSVQFLDGAASLGTVALGGGTALLTTASLAAGSHSITAVYGGDGNFHTASAALAQSVKASTVTTVTSNNASVAFEQAVQFTASVAPGSATGTVQFLDGVASLGTVTLSGGAASLTVATLSVGTHAITAIYSGDGGNSASTSAVWTQTIVKAATTATLSVTPNPSVAGQAVTLTAGISPAAATGMVQFFDGGTSLGTVTLSGGSASLSTGSLTAGSHSLTASYNADANYAASTSAAVTLVVKAASTIALQSSPSPSTYGQSVQFNAAVSPSTATGTVQFFDGATSLGAATVSGGAASLPLSTLAVGTHAITATYSGDANNTSATSAAWSQIVAKATATATVSAAPSPSTYGQSVTLTAAVSPSTATGTVQFFDGATSLGTATISGGAASLSVSTLAVGTHAITATYGGDANDTAATSAAFSQSVTKATATATVSAAPSPSTYGQSVTLTAAVSPSTATGTVQFFDGATSLGTATVSGGAASLSVSTLAVGAHAITAAYSGDANNTAATSAAWSQTVMKAASITTVSASPNPSTSGQSVTFTATVSPSAATGTVQFFDGSVSLGTATVSAAHAVLAVSTLAVGTHSIAAVYGGDASYATSTSATLTQTVNAVIPGAPANLTATAASSSQINLSWTASPTTGVTYNVYAGSTSGFTPAAANRIATGITATAYSNTGLAASTTRYYRVTAQNSAGESAASNQANATTQASLGCHVVYSVSTQWAGGFTAGVTIKNTGSAPINGWALTWTWPGNQHITQSWSATYSQTGANARLNNESYNPTIAAGATLTGVGFNASFTNTNPAPTAFYLNGTLCQ